MNSVEELPFAVCIAVLHVIGERALQLRDES